MGKAPRPDAVRVGILAFDDRGRAVLSGDGDWQEVALRYNAPYDLDALFAYLEGHLVRGIEAVKDGRYRRSVGIPQARGVIELEARSDAPAIHVRLQLEPGSDDRAVIERCRHLLDLDRDPRIIALALVHDPLLTPLVAARPGLRVAGALDGFELAVRAVVGQQVSVAGACTLLGRIVQRVGEPLRRPMGEVSHYFPTPHALAESDLSGLGITGRRIAALQALSRAVAAGEVDLRRGADAASTGAALQALPGFGPWTAQYIAMRALGEADACPTSDLGLRRALELHGQPGDPRSAAARAELWRPWRAYGIHHLWATLPSQRRASVDRPAITN